LAARQRNNIVARFHEMVTPVAARNVDARGRPTFRVPNRPRRAVKYYWKMHDPSYRKSIIDLVCTYTNNSTDKELIAEHRFYNIEHTDWAARLEGNTDSDDDELVRSDPFTLEEAVARYPERAVMGFVAAFAATLGSEPLPSTPSTSCSEWDRAAEGQLNDELQQASIWTVSPDTNRSVADSYDLDEQNVEPRPPGLHHLALTITSQANHHVDTLYNAESRSETQSGQSTPAPQGLQELVKNTKPSGPIRTRTKRDLTTTEISCVARSLIQGDAINFFINNCQLIYKGWITSVIGAASLTNASIDEFVIAAFDMLHSLRSHKDTIQLLMQFAYA
jgi:hypothetical protein